MALTPIDATKFAEEVNRLVLEAREQINARVAKAIRKRGAASDWALGKQAEMAEIERAMRQIMARLDARLAVAVNNAVADAHTLGSEQALRDLGLSVQGVLPPARLSAVAAIATDMHNTILGGLAQVLRQAPDIYQRVMSLAVSNMALGVYTRREATQLAVDRLARYGVTSFVDRAGRTWDIGTYSEMATRTGTAKAAIQGHVDTLVANGHPLVMIIPGPRVCPVCDEWVGKVLSLHWSAQDEFPGVNVSASLDDARAAGWGHPNCRCSLGAYIPGVSTLNPDRPPDSGYEASQQQRAIERSIRRWKDRERMAVTPEAKERARAKVREWQAAMREHLRKHPDLKRLPYRESTVRPRV